MKYFHRTHLPPASVLDQAQAFFGARLAPTAEDADRRRFAGAVGQVLVTVETNQVGESEADKLAKRFLTVVHTLADPTHRAIGAY